MRLTFCLFIFLTSFSLRATINDLTEERWAERMIKTYIHEKDISYKRAAKVLEKVEDRAAQKWIEEKAQSFIPEKERGKRTDSLHSNGEIFMNLASLSKSLPRRTWYNAIEDILSIEDAHSRKNTLFECASTPVKYQEEILRLMPQCLTIWPEEKGSLVEHLNSLIGYILIGQGENFPPALSKALPHAFQLGPKAQTCAQFVERVFQARVNAIFQRN